MASKLRPGDVKMNIWSTAKKNINNRDVLGETLLHRACSAGDLKAVKYLVENRADVNLSNGYGFTPLHLACISSTDPKGREEIIRMLVENRADVNLSNAYGFTPLHFACVQGSADIVRLLLEAGADPEARNDFKHTPLDVVSDLPVDDPHREVLLEILNEYGATLGHPGPGM